MLEQIARIDRAIAETRLLQQESDAFCAEQRRLLAESRRASPNGLLAPIAIGVTAAGAGAALFAAGGAFVRMMH